MTEPGRRFAIPSLDGMRAVFFLLVFVNHAGYHPVDGRVCLQMFFVLSGYLITTLLRRERELTGSISLRAYYLRRVLRIFPGLYIALGIALLLSVTHVLKDPFTWGGFTASALHLTNYWSAFGHRDDLIIAVGPYWSLAVEEHFYLLFPLLLLLLFRWRPTRQQVAVVLVVLAAVILAWRSWVAFSLPLPEAYRRAYYPTDAAADAILWGCVLGLVGNPALDVVHGSRRRWVRVALPVSLVAIWVAQALPQRWEQSLGYTVQALGFVTMIVVVVRFPDCWLGRLLNWRPVVFLGVMSYALYLLHYIAIFAVNGNLHWPHPIRAVVALAFTLVAAYLLYRFVEQPSARLRRRLARAWEAETVAERLPDGSAAAPSLAPGHP